MYSVICYNSGVGLISLLHGKKTIAIGNAYYTNKDLGYHSKNIFEAINIVKNPILPAPTEENIEKFAYWLINEKYSFYKSESVIRDFGHRKSHGYNNSKMYSFNYGIHFKTKLSRISQPFSEYSYGSAKLMISAGIHRTAIPTSPTPKVVEKKNTITTKEKTKQPAKDKVTIIPVEYSVSTKGTFSQKTKKLIRSPKDFFIDSKKTYLKRLGSFIFR